MQLLLCMTKRVMHLFCPDLTGIVHAVTANLEPLGAGGHTDCLLVQADLHVQHITALEASTEGQVAVSSSRHHSIHAIACTEDACPEDASVGSAGGHDEEKLDATKAQHESSNVAGPRHSDGIAGSLDDSQLNTPTDQEDCSAAAQPACPIEQVRTAAAAEVSEEAHGDLQSETTLRPQSPCRSCQERPATPQLDGSHAPAPHTSGDKQRHDPPQRSMQPNMRARARHNAGACVQRGQTHGRDIVGGAGGQRPWRPPSPAKRKRDALAEPIAAGAPLSRADTVSQAPQPADASAAPAFATKHASCTACNPCASQASPEVTPVRAAERLFWHGEGPEQAPQACFTPVPAHMAAALQKEVNGLLRQQHAASGAASQSSYSAPAQPSAALPQEAEDAGSGHHGSEHSQGSVGGSPAGEEPSTIQQLGQTAASANLHVAHMAQEVCNLATVALLWCIVDQSQVAACLASCSVLLNTLCVCRWDLNYPSIPMLAI